MKFRYLVYSGLHVWGKHVISKEYFIGAAKRDDLIIDLEEMKYFDIHENDWLPVEGDNE